MANHDHDLDPQSAVAIVGMSGRFPGAESVDELWRNLAAGVESVSYFSLDELRANGAPERDLQNPDYVRARGLLKAPELFDAAFFGISQREATLMDPQHRLFLESCWSALEHAAITPSSFPGLIGVWGGMSTGMTNNTYLLSNLHANPGALEPEDVLQALLGNENDYLTTRVSYKLNLRGPSVNVQTACSTSLIAVVQACQSLLAWQCDVALAGGVSVSYPQREGYLYQEGGIGSPDGHCRPFDANAEGTVFSNGVGVVVLRRLDEALRDRQPVYAVIRGWAMNNDGASKVSFAAPSIDGQAEVITMAQAAAGVTADTIGYVEAHGTGTPLGDPIEVAALTKAFRAGGALGTGTCTLGSIKSNFGHLDSAAGIAGLIKTVLALSRRQIPPTLHFTEPNPKCSFPDTPFVVTSQLRDWPEQHHPRRAGVSSFGIGGTNAHVVLEEAPANVEHVHRRGHDLPELLVLSAKTEPALDAQVTRLADYLDANPQVRLSDVAHTLQVGRQAHQHRHVVVGSTTEEVRAALRSSDGKNRIRGVAESGTRSVAFMFPGGGTQYVDMARGLRGVAPVFEAELARALSLLTDTAAVHSALFPDAAARDRAASELERPSIGLPALFAVEYALAQQWIAWGIRPDALIGHSMGEYTAACLSGVMSLEAALALVRMRGTLFETLAPGEMVGVPLAEADVRPKLVDGLAIAAVNAPSSCVVAGAPEALAAFERAMAEDGVECRRLHIAVAAHSPAVEPILGDFAAFVRTMDLAAPSIPIVSNLSGTWLTAAEAQSPEYWVRHLRETVRFFAGLETLVAEPNRVLLEVGPGQALGTFARQHPSRRPTQVVLPSLRHPKDTVPDAVFIEQSLGRLWVSGVPVDWQRAGASADQPVRLLALPTYPFERKPFLFAPEPRPRSSSPISAPQPDLPPPAPVPVLIGTETMTQPLVPDPSPVRPRADRICDRLVELLQKLSGLPASDIDPRVSFLEMGFDSLFLTQASLRFKSEFKVKVTFRQLFEEAPTLEALAKYIDSKLPADAFPAPAAAQPRPVAPVAAPVAAPASAHPAAPMAASPAAPSAPQTWAMPAPVVVPQSAAGASAIERVVQQQLQLMAEQLRMLGGQVALPAAYVPSPVHVAAAPPAVTVAAPAVEVPTIAAEEPESADSAQKPSVLPHFGPFRGIDKSGLALTPHQQKHLDRLIARYTTKTKKSKELTESQRARLADPRAVSGFRKLWKEMVYQLASVRSEGSRIWDIDGNEYIDVTSGFGVNLLGYALPFINEAVHKQLDAGIEIGTLSPLAKEAADLICEMTGMERASFANTGSESIAGAIRAVRTVTGREWIAVFDDEYHGIAEEVLVKSVGRPGHYRSASAAPGIPDHLVDKVIVLHYNDPGALDIIRERADDLAAVIIEPVQNRHPDFRPIDMIRAVRQVTKECDIPLVFDEMITGFRLHQRGAQGYFDVECDVACYGKIMSGGLPIAAIAGKAQYLDAFDGGPWRFGDDSYPEGGVTFFGGTFTRNPLSLAASVAALRHLKEAGPQLQEQLNAKSDRFAERINAAIERYGAPMRLEHCGSVCNFTFKDDNPLVRLVHYHLREKGVHIWDRPFFISVAHTEAELDTIVRAFDQSLAEMVEAQFFEAPPSGGPTPPGPKDRDEVPLTDAQIEVWLGSKMSPQASCTFNEVVAIDLVGPLDVPAMERALGSVVARHESLRMTVTSGEQPMLRIADVVNVPLTLVDVGSMDESLRDEEIARRLRSADTEPFNLEEGPLVRMTLIRKTATHHVLVMAAHHLVCDGWSFGTVLRDLSAFYSASLEHRPALLPPALQASEYTRQVLEAKASGEADEAERYWLSQFETVPEPLELPTDRPRPSVRSHRGRRIGVLLDGELAQGAKRLAAQQRATVFTTLLSVFEVLVHRLTGQPDFAVGIPMAGQALLEGQDLVTHCVNFVPLRATVDPALSFRDYLGAVRKQSLDLNEYQNFTYGSLLSKLKLPRDPARNPLVSVSFTVEPAIADLTFHGLRTKTLTAERTTSKRDLHMNVMEVEAGLLVEADFNSDIFDESTIERWLEAYRCLLAAAIETPERRIAELPLMSDAERQRIVYDWNQTTSTYDTTRPIHQIVEEWAKKHPDDPAVVSEREALTWATLNRQANQLGSMLMRRGAGKSSVVAICLERSADFVTALLAIHKIGAAYVPLDPAYPAERLAFLVSDSGARAVVTRTAFVDKLSGAGAPIVRLDGDRVALEKEPSSDLQVAVAPQDLAYVIYTSGSTGQPKGVGIEHRQLLNYTWALLERLALPARSSFALVSTVSADLGNTSIFPALASGGLLHVLSTDSTSDARKMVDYFEGHTVDVLKITPSHLGMLLMLQSSRALLPKRCLVLGGESARPHWVSELQHLAPECAIVNHYGPTETTIGALTFKVEGDAASIPGDGLPLGRPLGNVRVYVLDPSGAPVPIGVAGELFIGGGGVARGYLNRDDLTKAKFLADPFVPGARVYRTGDRARWRADGTIEFLGRVDNQVKIRGFRVELGEVESLLEAHAGVDAAVVLLREDVPGDPRLVAYVIGAGADVAALHEHLRKKLPEHALPSAYVRMTAWPLTSNGKIDRRALPPPSDSVRDTRQEMVEARTDLERKLVSIWQDVLRINRISVTDDFFEIGGHSLAAARVFFQIEKTLGASVPLSALFDAPTVERLAVVVQRTLDERVTDWPALVEITKGTGTPVFCVHSISGDVLEYRNLAKWSRSEQPLIGVQAKLGSRVEEIYQTIEATAAAYVAEIRKHQPKGPYYFAGWSSGATLILEIAQQLQADGEQIALLAAFDSAPDNIHDWDRGSFVTRAMRQAVNVPRWIRDDLLTSRFSDVLWRTQQTLKTFFRRSLVRLGGAEERTRSIREVVNFPKRPPLWEKFVHMHYEALHRYVPRKYDGKVTVFIAKTHPLFWLNDSDRIWRRLTSDVDVRRLPGTHFTLMKDPNLETLAAALDDVLANAREAARASSGNAVVSLADARARRSANV